MKEGREAVRRSIVKIAMVCVGIAWAVMGMQWPSALGAEVDELDEMMDRLEEEVETGVSSEKKLAGLMVEMGAGPSYMRRSAIWRSTRYRDYPQLIARFEKYVKEQPSEIASISAVALGKMGAGASAATLIAALDSESEWVRESAAYALGLIGEQAALPGLKKRRPREAGLSRWIYEDAIARVQGRAGAPSPYRPALEGASVYFIGANGTLLGDSWRHLVKRYGLRIDGEAPGSINPPMARFGGAPDLKRFYELLVDKNGKPQIDVVMVAGLFQFEFPAKCRWKLYQFVRRGGRLISIGNATFVRGKIRTVNGRVVHRFAMPRQLWQALLPPEPDNEFRPFVAGIRGDYRQALRTGVREFGHGRVILWVGAKRRDWGLSRLPLSHLDEDIENRYWQARRDPLPKEKTIEKLLLYAMAGEKPFPALVDLYEGPGQTVAGKSVSFALNLYSATRSSGSVELELLFAKRTVARRSFKINARGRPLTRLKPRITVPWDLPDGQCRARMTFKTPQAKHTDEWPFQVMSPLRFEWRMEDSYEQTGGILLGKATIENQRHETLRGLTLALEVSDERGRTLQRSQSDVVLRPGMNGPFPLALRARDYRIGSYYLTLKLRRGEKVIQSSQRLLHRCGPYDFQRDLVYVPWSNYPVPSAPRMRQLLLSSGFNAVHSLEAYPGWYNWSLGPLVCSTPTWPGELIEQTRVGGAGQMSMKELAHYLRRRLPGYTVMDPWDETAFELVDNVRGEDMGPTGSVFYRNWLKSRYLSLAAVNDSWRKQYRTWRMPAKTRIPRPRAWEGDLSSWNQIWAWRGVPKDWQHYLHGFGFEAIFSELRPMCRKIDPNHWWHGHHGWVPSECYHTRINSGDRPGNLNRLAHNTRGRYGSRPSTIMLHIFYVTHDIRPGPMRHLHWDGLAGGGRHFIIYAPTVNESDDCSTWTPGYTLRPHGKVLADSIFRVRSKEQVLLDTVNSLSAKVAVLYHVGNPRSVPGALLDALIFGGICPDSLKVGMLRSERMPLDSFRVIFLYGERKLPKRWQERLDEWQKKGGKLLFADDFRLQYGEAESETPGFTQSTDVSSIRVREGDRIETPGFTRFQSGVLAKLREHGVVPPIQVVDDNGLPEASVEPVLLQTRDQSQFYVLAAVDWSLEYSQAFGDLPKHPFREKIELNGNFAQGQTFSVTGKAEKYQLWAETHVREPFAARVTVDGKPGLPLVLSRKARSELRAERGVGTTRWIAGPAFSLNSGKHVLKIEPQRGRPAIRRIWIVDDLLVRPKLVCNLPGVKEVYDVFNDRMLVRVDDGWRLPLRASYGEIYALITEALGPVEVEPRLLAGKTDRRIQLKIRIRRADGALSQCRHALNIRIRDGKGKVIEGLFRKASVRGWRVVTLYVAGQDPPLPWTVEVKDLSSGRTGRATVSRASAKPFKQLAPKADLVLRTEATPALEADVNIVPFRITVTNNGKKAVSGRVKTEIPADLLLEGKQDVDIRIAAGKTRKIEWVAVLGRKQAVRLREHPPRVWLKLPKAKTLEAQFDDVYALGWEKTPPLITNAKVGEIKVSIQNCLERKLRARMKFGFSRNWKIVKKPPRQVQIPAASKTGPSTCELRFTARLKDLAEQSPEIYQMPLALHIGDKVFDAGIDLVETEKRRRWYVTTLPEFELDKSTQGKTQVSPEALAKAVDARKSGLWGLTWRAFESDTLIDFPGKVGDTSLAVSNVRFPKAGKISVRVRADEEKVQVWLGGTLMAVDKHRDRQTADTAEETLENVFAEKKTDVPGRQWVPIVVQYKQIAPFPLTDMVFLDEKGKVIWGADVKADIATTRAGHVHPGLK